MGLVYDGVEFREPQELPLLVSELSKGAHCLYGWSQDWGQSYLRLAAHSHKHFKSRPKFPYFDPAQRPLPMAYTVDWMRQRIQKALEGIGKGLVIAAFPTFTPYNKNASLLLEQGFRLLGRRCYPNVNYPIAQHVNMPLGSAYSPDGYSHWIHIWVKDLGGLEECGESLLGRPKPEQGGLNALPVQEPAYRPAFTGWPNCCGLRFRWSYEDLPADPYAPLVNNNAYLSICQVPASQRFNNGFKRFALYKDFKWGVNFDNPQVKGVQKCPHEFDLAKIEKWELAQPLPELC